MPLTTPGSNLTVPFSLNYSFRDVLAAAGYRVLSMTQFGDAGIVAKINNGHRAGTIIATQADWDGVEWLHASIDFPGLGEPTYQDLVMLHHAVYGRKRYAYQVFAPEVDHVNIRETALHLWGRADGKISTPDFGVMGTI